MTPAEWKKQQIQTQQAKTITKRNISNNFIDSSIKNNTVGALKIIYFIAQEIEKCNKKNLDDNLLKLNFNLQDMLNYIGISLKTIKRNINAMQKTIISFVSINGDLEENISLIPRIKINYGGTHANTTIQIDIYKKVSQLFIDVSKNYSKVDTREIARLRSKHAIRILPILYKIENYDSDIPKLARFTLDDLNSIFGTNYKSISNIEKNIIKDLQEELNKNSKLSFIYDISYKVLGKGRPKATTINFHLKENENNSIFFS